MSPTHHLISGLIALFVIANALLFITSNPAFFDELPLTAQIAGSPTTYYFSTSGNDSNNGLSASSPRKSLAALQALLNISEPGDQFLLKRGDTWTTGANISTPYSGIVALDFKNVDGNSGNYITIGAYGSGNKPTFDICDSNGINNGKNAVVQLEGSTYTNIKDIHFTCSDFTTGTYSEYEATVPNAYINRPYWVFHAIGSINGGAHHIKFSGVDIDNMITGYQFQDASHNITLNDCTTQNLGFPGSGIFADIDGLTVTDSVFAHTYDNGHMHGIYFSDTTNVLIENNLFYDGNNAISIPNGRNIIVRNNTLHDFSWSAIATGARNYGGYRDLLDGVVIEGNLIYNAPIGINVKTYSPVASRSTSVISNLAIRDNVINSIDDYAGLMIEQIYQLNNAVFANNTFYNNIKGIFFESSNGYSNNVVKNNILYNNQYSSGTLVEVGSSSNLSNIDFDYNLYRPVVGSAVKIGGVFYPSHTGFGEESHGITADPQFINAGAKNFNLQSSSPAINKGTAINGRTSDFLGNSIIGLPDIGSYEYQGSVSTPQNTPPTISLTSPQNNSSYTAQTPLAITASAPDPDGTITTVELLRGGSTSLGSDSSSPFTIIWQNPPAGTYTLTAKATDDDNAQTTSAPITITITTPQQSPTLTPTTQTSPSPTPIVPTGWTFCSDEYEQCIFTGTKEVLYGLNSLYATDIFTEGVFCDNSIFGDPYPGFVKQCYYRDLQATPTPPASSPTQTSGGGGGGGSGGGGGGGSTIRRSPSPSPTLGSTSSPQAGQAPSINPLSDLQSRIQTLFSILQSLFLKVAQQKALQTAPIINTTPTVPTQSCPGGICTIGGTDIFSGGNTVPPTSPSTGSTGSGQANTGFNRNLTIGSQGEDARQLQLYLNQKGLLVSTSGAGSPGNETTLFGQRTLARFQQAHNINPPSGYFGPVSREFINRDR